MHSLCSSFHHPTNHRSRSRSCRSWWVALQGCLRQYTYHGRGVQLLLLFLIGLWTGKILFSPTTTGNGTSSGSPYLHHQQQQQYYYNYDYDLLQAQSPFQIAEQGTQQQQQQQQVPHQQNAIVRSSSAVFEAKKNIRQQQPSSGDNFDEQKNVVLTGGQQGQQLSLFHFEEDSVVAAVVASTASRNTNNHTNNNNNDNKNKNSTSSNDINTEVDTRVETGIEEGTAATVEAGGGEVERGTKRMHNDTTTTPPTDRKSTNNIPQTKSPPNSTKGQDSWLYHYPSALSSSNSSSSSGKDTNVHNNNSNNTQVPIILNTNGNEIGIVSTKQRTFFRTYQAQIDALDETERCTRYGFGVGTAASPITNTNNGSSSTTSHTKTKNTRSKTRRRIFFGALMASEPWELFEIVATEAYGIYAGIVLVESNRTQNFSPRPVTRVDDDPQQEQGGAEEGTTTTTTRSRRNTTCITRTTTHIIQHLFQTQNVQLRLYVNEDNTVLDLDRESAQRDDILLGWHELGMQGDDIGIISDMDEVLTRDFLNALQQCDEIEPFNYEKYRCNPTKMGVRTTTVRTGTVLYGNDSYCSDLCKYEQLTGIVICISAPTLSNSIYILFLFGPCSVWFLSLLSYCIYYHHLSVFGL